MPSPPHQNHWPHGLMVVDTGAFGLIPSITFTRKVTLLDIRSVGAQWLEPLYRLPGKAHVTFPSHIKAGAIHRDPESCGQNRCLQATLALQTDIAATTAIFSPNVPDGSDNCPQSGFSPCDHTYSPAKRQQ
ncbi:hypothetical protein FPOAC2_02246 [Fusarium poae]|jgi:hypothetical protein|uniref:hypothetical protein n=1 Tax=Fusarium poae TaxID=36050 RepID=UPI001CE72E3E|nr:hypothetical protein FPOAC1_002157 [Fusarium poae]KAG8676158.1 hypothetical protein FPOAC1_002157 [Fusarium poae]